MQEEFMDIVDTEDQVTGKTTKSEIYKKGFLHRIVHILIFNEQEKLERAKKLLEIDGKLKTKHVASLKIAMKDFFDSHIELKPEDGEEKYITIKIIKPFEEYKL
ncbi:hypothetical protein HYU06_06620, partial [Candidatus Woesearchaeota archaeon]|nr:hypothetical protein [Candidatus Woesearchaeota archaeon]